MKTILAYKQSDWETDNCQVPTSNSTPTPQRWLDAEREDPALARSRWRHTSWYRQEFGVDTILSTPHPLFDIISQHVPLAYLGLTLNQGHPISLECFPKINHVTLKKLGIGLSEIFFHYLWITEYGRVHIKDASTYNILDTDGSSLSMLYGKKKELANLLGSYFEQHMPETTHAIDIINAPGWFNWMVYPLIKLIAAKETLRKLQVFSTANASFVAHASEQIDMNQIPIKYGGTLETGAFEGEHAVLQRKVAMQCLNIHGLGMWTEAMLVERLMGRKE